MSHRFLPHTASVRSSQVMDHFGVTFEQGEHVVAANVEIPIQNGQLVLFTGESGSGKSSMMRQAAALLRQEGRTVIDLDQLSWKSQTLVDLMNLPLDECLQLLASCGLAEAQLMLRTPEELSDGQRYRFRIAFALSQKPDWVVADEFAATLDRQLARLLAFNLRKIATRTGTGFLLATTHEDVANDLSADFHLRCHLSGGHEHVSEPGESNDDTLKKKNVVSQKGCGFPPRPSPIGRTSLGGIIGATIWD
ncbi:ATP-binding cassette domain-containing protein [Planctomicrobium sp. SH668]|uniref:ATP-binding cassette domain-containing protein n=1 Tax=Planctomicrobium sp. SH668 TaxID=3448126 RepID=UPI003F5C0F45